MAERVGGSAIVTKSLENKGFPHHLLRVCVAVMCSNICGFCNMLQRVCCGISQFLADAVKKTILTSSVIRNIDRALPQSMCYSLRE